MFKRTGWLLGVAVALICAASAAAPQAAAFTSITAETWPRNVVLIGWDGAQREHVQQCLSRGELPNLAALGKAGALVDIDISETTDTKAGWSQILTGYSAKITGVYSNSHYQPIPQGYTIFERLEQHFGAHAVATLAVIGKDQHVGNDPPQRIRLNAAGDAPANGLKKGQAARKAWRKKMAQGKVVEEDGAKYLETPGCPYYITQNSMDLFQNGLHKNDVVGARALEVLEHYKGQRFFFFVHFADVDHKGHGFGENSKEYNDALISSDQWTGKIIDKLRELGIDADTTIYVTADHGFDEGMRQHRDAPYVFLGTNDRAVTRAGNRMDIAPTIMQRLGLDLGSFTPPLSGKPLT
jgi:hypothetical protein